MLARFLTVCAVVTALPAAAQDLRTTGSWAHGAWRAATMENTASGLGFCAAETTSLFDQVLRLVLYENADAFLEIRDVTWGYMNGEPLRFHLIVDGDERTVIGQGWDGSMSLDLIDAGARRALLGWLGQGGRLDVRMPNRSRVAQFSLEGAAPAIAAAETCWEVIQAGGSYAP